MLQRHETCELNARKRNLVLPKKTVIQTVALVLFLIGTSLISPFSAAPYKPDKTVLAENIETTTETLAPAQFLKGNAQAIQFQLKKQLVAGGHLNVIQVSVRLNTSSFNFNAQVQGDGKTVDALLSGSVQLPNDDWAILEVEDNAGNIVEKYLVQSQGGICTVIDLEH